MCRSGPARAPSCCVALACGGRLATESLPEDRRCNDECGAHGPDREERADAAALHAVQAIEERASAEDKECLLPVPRVVLDGRGELHIIVIGVLGGLVAPGRHGEAHVRCRRRLVRDGFIRGRHFCVCPPCTRDGARTSRGIRLGWVVGCDVPARCFQVDCAGGLFGCCKATGRATTFHWDAALAGAYYRKTTQRGSPHMVMA
jgi:hypothetical protein